LKQGNNTLCFFGIFFKLFFNILVIAHEDPFGSMVLVGTKGKDIALSDIEY